MANNAVRSASAQEQIDRINAYLKTSPDDSQVARGSFIDLAQTVLGKSYNGFNYIYWTVQGFNEWLAAGRPESNRPFICGPSGDETRVFFY